MKSGNVVQAFCYLTKAFLVNGISLKIEGFLRGAGVVCSVQYWL